jgi:hypothetical protein
MTRQRPFWRLFLRQPPCTCGHTWGEHRATPLQHDGYRYVFYTCCRVGVSQCGCRTYRADLRAPEKAGGAVFALLAVVAFILSLHLIAAVFPASAKNPRGAESSLRCGYVWVEGSPSWVCR